MDNYEQVAPAKLRRIKKGTRIVFRYFTAFPTCLAGAQMKMGASEVRGEGIVRNIWADDPEGKTNVRFNTELPDGSMKEIKAVWVIGVGE